MYTLGLDLFGKDECNGGNKVAHSKTDVVIEISMAKVINISYSKSNQVPWSEDNYSSIVNKIKIL